MSVDLEALKNEIATERLRIARLEVIRDLAEQAIRRGVPAAEARSAVEDATGAWTTARFAHVHLRRAFMGKPITATEVMERTGQSRRDVQRDLAALTRFDVRTGDGAIVHVVDATNVLYGVIGNVLHLDSDPELSEELLSKLADSTDESTKRANTNSWTAYALLWVKRQISEASRRRTLARARKASAHRAQLELRVFGAGTDAE